PGIRPVELAAPLATFTGWNPRHPDQGAGGDLMAMLGSTLPFAGSAGARRPKGGPPPSIEERYASREAYLERARESATGLVAERHMLAEDVDTVVERAGRLWDFIARACTTRRSPRPSPPTRPGGGGCSRRPPRST